MSCVTFPSFANFFEYTLQQERNIPQSHPLYQIQQTCCTKLEKGQTEESRMISLLDKANLRPEDPIVQRVVQNTLIKFHHAKIKDNNSSSVAEKIHQLITPSTLIVNDDYLNFFSKFCLEFPRGIRTVVFKQNAICYAVPEALVKSQWTIHELVVGNTVEIPETIRLSHRTIGAFNRALLRCSIKDCEQSIKTSVLQLLDFIGASQCLALHAKDLTNFRDRSTPVTEMIENFNAAESTCEPKDQPQKIGLIQSIRYALRRRDYSGFDSNNPETVRLVTILEKIHTKRNNIQFVDMGCSTMSVRHSFNLGPGAFTAKKVTDMQFLINQAEVKKIHFDSRASVDIDRLYEVLLKTPHVTTVALHKGQLENGDKEKLQSIPHIKIEIY